jgi:hypothetical protein
LREGNCLGEKWLTMTRPSSSAAIITAFHSTSVRPSKNVFFFSWGGKLLCVDAPARLGMIHVPR